MTAVGRNTHPAARRHTARSNTLVSFSCADDRCRRWGGRAANGLEVPLEPLEKRPPARAPLKPDDADHLPFLRPESVCLINYILLGRRADHLVFPLLGTRRLTRPGYFQRHDLAMRPSAGGARDRDWK